jgi:hypothetical protein
MKHKFLIILASFLFFILGLWPISVLCIILLSLPVLRKFLIGLELTELSILLTAFFLLVSLLSGGRLSSVILASTLAFFLFYNNVRGTVTQDENSIIMRDKVLPFFWYAIGKVKFTSQRYVESIAAIPNVSFMLRFKGDIYAIFSCIALRSNIATEKIFTKMREAQEAINSRGSYIIPVSFPKMNEILSLERINLKATISHGEIVSFRNKGERVFMVSSFRKSGRKKSIPFPREKKLLSLNSILDGIHYQTDSESSFLLALTTIVRSGLLDGIREERHADGTISVRCLSSPSLEFEKREYEALMRIYLV